MSEERDVLEEILHMVKFLSKDEIEKLKAEIIAKIEEAGTDSN